MHLKSIYLKNFRGFEEFEMELHPEVTLLVGENGAGKTTLFDALRMALSHFTQAFGTTQIGAEQPAESDGRVVAIQSGTTVTLEAAGPVTLRTISSADAEKSMENGHFGFWLASVLKDSLSSDPQVELPLVVAYPATLSWAARPADSLRGLSRLEGYRHWQDPPASQTEVLRWIRQAQYTELQEAEAEPRLAALLGSIKSCVEGCDDVAFNVRADTLRFRINGETVLFPHLSAGYRRIIAMAADLAWRCVTLNPQHGGDAPALTAGVVLIDELELLLHPRWQWQILPSLRKTFPNVQFIATTHAPAIIATAKPEWIRVLRAGQSKPDSVVHSDGMDVNAVLESVMGVPAMSGEISQLVERCARALHDGDIAAASTLLADARQRYGGANPIFVELEWELADLKANGAQDSPAG